MKSAFIVLPSLSATGPVIGALALANGLSQRLPVTLVPLKSADRQVEIKNPNIEVFSLANVEGWRQKRKRLIRLFRERGDRKNIVSVSFCFSADIFNSQLKKYARTISSVRGNLLKVYRFDYGFFGIFAALLHYIFLHRFDHVVAISKKMARQLKFFGISDSVVIHNFVDEQILEAYRKNSPNFDGILRFAFLGRLTTLKRPFLLIQAFSDLLKRGRNYRLDIIGDGPLRHQLVQKCKALGLMEYVTFHGHLANPYNLLQQCHVLVLPSETEGVPRAVMEGLFYGIPCILRDVDANHELLDGHNNCYLFKKDAELVEIMEKAAGSFCSNGSIGYSNFLPQAFYQEHNLKKFLELILDNGR